MTRYFLQALLVAATMMWTNANADNWTPTNLVSTGSTSNSVALSWTPPVDTNGVTGYKVLSATGELLGSPTTNSFSVTGLKAATAYNFMVVACYVNIGCEAQGPTMAVTTLAAAPVVVAPVVPDVNVTLPSLSAKAAVSTAVAGPITKQTISLTAKVPDTQGKPMTMYVVGILQGSVYFLNSNGTWSLYTGSKSVQAFQSFGLSSGPSEISVPVVSEANLSGIVGFQIFVGYGLGVVGLSDPFQSMILNSTYDVVYTIK